MGKTVKGIYENGRIRLREDPRSQASRKSTSCFQMMQSPVYGASLPALSKRLTASLRWGAMLWRTPRACGRSTCVLQIITDTSMLVPRLDASCRSHAI